MDVSKLYERAEDAVKRKNYDYAIEVLKNQILSIYPDDVKARKLLRGCENRRCAENGYPSAFSALIAGFVPLIKIRLFKLMGKHEKVMEECENYLLIDPRSKSVLSSLAYAAASAEHLDTAISQYEACLEVDRNHAPSYRALAQIYEAQDELGKAQEYYDKAGKLDPSDGDSQRKVKQIAARMTAADYGGKSSRENLKDSDKARELDMDQKILRSKEDYLEAIEIQKKRLAVAADGSGDFKKAIRALGEYYAAINDYPKAIEFLDKGIKADPSSFDLTVALGDCRISEMERHIKRAAKKAAAGDAAAAKKKKALERKLMDYQIEEFTRRVEAHPTDLEQRFQLGRVQFRDRQYDEAIGHLQKSAKDPRRKLDSYDMLGQAFLKQGENGLAINQFQKALEGLGGTDDRSKRVRYNLAQAFEQDGKKAEAFELYQALMEQDINYKDVKTKVKELR